MTPSIQKKKENESHQNVIDSPIQDKGTRLQNILEDPDYLALINFYQQANLEKAKDLLSSLQLRYPDEEKLTAFQKNLEMQLSLKQLSVNQLVNEKKQKTRSTLKLSAFTIVSMLVVVVIFIGSYLFLDRFVQVKTTDTTSQVMADYENQVMQLLQSGQPQVARKVIDQMREIEPNYASLSSLQAQTDELLSFETQYQVALGLISTQNFPGALSELEQIEAQKPGLWDIPRQIALVKGEIEIKKLLEEGNLAYQGEKWEKVITAYENALLINPKLEDAVMKEQLLNSYLRRIVQLLESNSTSTEDIENAEQYFRKASSMIPQSRTFSSERGNLEEVSSNLLELKFTQSARILLEAKDQSFASVSKAVGYLNKAVNLNPKNASLQNDLRNAQLYQIGFQDYIELNWGPAISNLTQLLQADSKYANGNAAILLYDAYFALGSQYYSVGLYQDARRNLEQAEILSFEDKENLLRLFQVQTLLGDTIGGMGDFPNAVSYYQYAFNSIGIYSRLSNEFELYSILINADSEAIQGLYADALAKYQLLAGKMMENLTVKEVEIPDGTCLAFFAAEHQSTTSAILAENKLPQSMIISFGRVLRVPVIE